MTTYPMSLPAWQVEVARLTRITPLAAVDLQPLIEAVRADERERRVDVNTLRGYDLGKADALAELRAKVDAMVDDHADPNEVANEVLALIDSLNVTESSEQ